MARTTQQVEADLKTVYAKIEILDCFDRAFDELVSQRNNLLIELCQAENPVHQQKQEIGFVILK